MRNIKELLELLLSQLNDGNMLRGMCHVVSSMASYHVITDVEFVKLTLYIRSHRPIKLYYHYDGFRTTGINQFWYKPGELKYRILWLNKHIELNTVPTLSDCSFKDA